MRSNFRVSSSRRIPIGMEILENRSQPALLTAALHLPDVIPHTVLVGSSLPAAANTPAAEHSAWAQVEASLLTVFTPITEIQIDIIHIDVTSTSSSSSSDSSSAGFVSSTGSIHLPTTSGSGSSSSASALNNTGLLGAVVSNAALVRTPTVATTSSPVETGAVLQAASPYLPPSAAATNPNSTPATNLLDTSFPPSAVQLLAGNAGAAALPPSSFVPVGGVDGAVRGARRREPSKRTRWPLQPSLRCRETLARLRPNRLRRIPRSRRWPRWARASPLRPPKPTAPPWPSSPKRSGRSGAGSARPEQCSRPAATGCFAAPKLPG